MEAAVILASLWIAVAVITSLSLGYVLWVLDLPDSPLATWGSKRGAFRVST